MSPFLPTPRHGGARRSAAVGALALLLVVPALLLGAKGNLADAQKRFVESGLVKKRACMTCHAVGESGGTVGPKLDHVGLRRDVDWLRRWLKNPQTVRPGTVMPNFMLSDEEVDELAALLSALREGVDAGAIMSGDGTAVEKGRALFEGYDCYACHRIGDEGRFIGPDLTWLGRRRTTRWETAWLTAPELVKPGTFMPNFGLPARERDAIVAYLMTLQGEANARSQEWELNTAFQLSSRPREIGERVYRRFGCDGCHGRGGKGGYANPNAAPDGMMPAVDSAASKYPEAQFSELLSHSRTPPMLDKSGDDPLPCPAWIDLLTEDELHTLYAYIESISPKS